MAGFFTHAGCVLLEKNNIYNQKASACLEKKQRREAFFHSISRRNEGLREIRLDKLGEA